MYRIYYFVLASRLEKPKNLEIVIEAFNELKKLEKIRLLVVGKGRYENFLKSMVGKNVIFTGFVSEEKLKRIFKKSYACIMPHKYEPLGLVPYEIAKYGKPSIVSKLSGMAELVEKFKFGILFNPDSKEDLKKKIIKLVQDKKLYKKLSKNTRKLISSVNAVSETEKIIKYIKF